VVLAGAVLLATGALPRSTPGVVHDGEHVLGPASLAALKVLPSSIVVLGAGAEGCVLASVFAALGVRVTLVERGSRPMPFLEAELSARFVEAFVRRGGTFLARRTVQNVEVGGRNVVKVELDGGEAIVVDRVLDVPGREANVASLGLSSVGLRVGSNGLLPVDARGRTGAARLWAAGEVCGPAGVTASAEQGRRVAFDVLGFPSADSLETSTMLVRTIPELASVGEADASVAKRGVARVGRAILAEASDGPDRGGLLKVVTDVDGRLVGVQAVGEALGPLVHAAESAIRSGARVHELVADRTFSTATGPFAAAVRDLKRQTPLPAEAEHVAGTARIA